MARATVERIWAALLMHKGGTRSTNENLTKVLRYFQWVTGRSSLPAVK